MVLPDNTVALGTKTTGDYVSSLVAGTGVTLSDNTGETATPTISIGQSVGTSASVTFANLTVTGDLTVSGTTTSINTETLTVDDNIIVLNNNATGAPSANAGIEIERGSSANVALRWNETSDKWELTTDGSAYADIATETYAASLTPATLDVIGDVTITGAASGQFLKWNGTAWVNDAIDLSTDTTGDYVATLTAGTGITLSNNSGEGASPTVAVDTTVIAPLASPNFTGTPTLPTGTIATTQTALDSSTKVATTAFVTTADALKADLASPTFTGTVTLPSGTVTSTMILDGTIANADISTTAAIDLGKLADVSTSAQTASYTLVLADKNKIVEMSVATANTLTVPPNSSVAYAVGSQINILQTGAGQTTVTAGVGVTVNAAPGLKMRTQWSYATLVKRATDTWVLVGDISA